MYFEMRHTLIASANLLQPASVEMSVDEVARASFSSFMTEDSAEHPEGIHQNLAQETSQADSEDAQEGVAEEQLEAASDVSVAEKEYKPEAMAGEQGGEVIFTKDALPFAEMPFDLPEDVSRMQVPKTENADSDKAESFAVSGMKFAAENSPQNVRAETVLPVKSPRSIAVKDNKFQTERDPKIVDNSPVRKTSVVANNGSDITMASKALDFDPKVPAEIIPRSTHQTTGDVKNMAADVVLLPRTPVWEKPYKSTEKHVHTVELKSNDASNAFEKANVPNTAINQKTKESIPIKISETGVLNAEVYPGLIGDVDGLEKTSQSPIASPLDVLGATISRSVEIKPNSVELPRLIASQLTEAVKSSSNSLIELNLNPEELGRVRMTFSTQDTGLAMVLQIDRPETLELMRRNIEVLSQEFKNMGYTNISFDFGQSENGSNDDPSGSSVAGYHGDFDEDPDVAQITIATVTDGLDLRL